MLERGGAPDPKTVPHLDRCLSCLSCMTTCAVKVDYAHLIDRARAYIGQFPPLVTDRSLRALLARVLPAPRPFGAACRSGGWPPTPAFAAAATADDARHYPAADCVRYPCAAGLSGRRHTEARRAARRLRAAGARRRHQRRDPPAVAASRLRGGDRARRRLLRFAPSAYGPRARGACVRAECRGVGEAGRDSTPSSSTRPAAAPR